MVSSPAPAPTTDYAFLAAELRERDAAAFVHVGDRFDDDQRYLTRFSGPDRDYAYVYVDGEAVLCAPALFEEQARREFPGDVVYAPADLDAEAPGQQAVEVLDAYDVGADETVLVPQHLPHDAALYLDGAGVDLASTDAVAAARTTKSDAEVDCLRAVQASAQRAMARVETFLAEAEQDGTALTHEGERLTSERLRREANAVLAGEGVDPAANTVVGVGETCADLHFRGDVPVDAGETVLVDLSPRGPHGYYGDLTRTFVVDAEGGWERRAHLAVQRAQDAAFDELDAGAGVAASLVHTETAAEVAAYGFDTGYDADTGFTHETGHGVGLSLHESPSLSDDVELAAGTVVTVEPGVYDPTEGGVRIEDLVVVTEDGFENLTDYPRSLVPEPREWV
ncbi:M24 family metallopeptidase [Halospeciosus flavus]|uniref:M24 family metallopeptidase n=1 Tax=Halospeciosus flavus TaxID=3032283 RepID=A0ABD5Z5M0_9EURY|nr:Xaa-Pro peptidase family protein [Halospeciosus flavus]